MAGDDVNNNTASVWAAVGAWLSFGILLIMLITLLIWKGQQSGWTGWSFDIRGMFGSLWSGVSGWFSGLGAIGSPFRVFLTGVTSAILAVGLFAPDVAVLIGLAADAANARVRYSVTSAFAMLAALINWALSFFTAAAGRPETYSLGGILTPSVAAAAATAAPPTIGAIASTIGFGTTPAPRPAASVVSEASRPGASGRTVSTLGSMLGGAMFKGSPAGVLGIPLGVKNQPAGLAVLMTIFTMYSLDMMNKRSGGEIAGQLITGAFIVGLYATAYHATDGLTLSALWPIGVGLAIGGMGYGILDNLAPQYLPLDPEQSPNPTGEYSKCAASGGGSNNEFVCDAYLNGQRIGTVPT